MNVGMIHSVFEKEMALFEQWVSYLVCKKKKKFLNTKAEKGWKLHVFCI